MTWRSAELAEARRQQSFDDVADLCQRAALDRRHQGLLADAGALKELAGHRHKARWAVSGVEAPLPLFDAIAATPEASLAIPKPSIAEDMVADYGTVGMTLGTHPVALIRAALRKRRCLRSSELANLPHGRHLRFAGMVRLRQRPETASGVTFLTLEDEDGMVNAVVWQKIAERQRRVRHGSQFIAIDARLEHMDGVQHLIVRRMEDYDGLLQGIRTPSRDYC